MSRIKFQRQQGNIKGKSSLELLNEFFMFLQGECPDAISVREMPKLNSQQAFSVIYYISVSPKWRKATVYELIEHFKTKEE